MLKRNLMLCAVIALGALLLFGCKASSGTGLNTDQLTEEFLVEKPDLSKGAAMHVDPTIDFTWDLVAGQNMLAGTVHVYNDANWLYVAYQLNDPWLMTEAHVLVSTTMPDPKGGAPGKFPYKAEFDPQVDAYTFEIPLGDLEGKSMIYLATHAATTNGETIWGGEWNDGDPTYNFEWKKWGGGFTTNVMPFPDMPADWVKYYATHYGTYSYWNMYFQNPYPAGEWFVSPAGNPWSGWCVDQAHTMYSGRSYWVKLYSCYDPGLPAFAASENWDIISYLITKRIEGQGIYNVTWTNNGNKDAFQNAVWYFKGGGSMPATGSLAWKFVQDGIANGDGFIPGPGEYFAVILFPDTTGQYERCQMNIIEVDP